MENRFHEGIIGIVINKKNKYSWASIIGALESEDIFNKYKLNLISGDNFFSIVEKIDLDKSQDKFILLSLNSIDADQIINDLKEYKKGSPRHDKTENTPFIIAGGPHASARPLQLLNAGIDLVIINEGERAIIEFFHQYFLSGKNQVDFRRIPNSCFRTSKNRGAIMVRSKNSSPVILDDYPAFAARHRLFRPIEISRGCPHGCYFCQTSKIFGYKMRHRSVENIIKWTRKAVSLKYDKLWMTTPNALAYGSKTGLEPNIALIEKLLKELTAIPGLNQVFFGTFPSEIRPEFVSDEIMDAITPYVSNKRFIIGAQTASQRMLDLNHSGHTADDIWNAVDIITSRGFRVDVDMIFGLPGENQDDKIQNMNFIREAIKNPSVKIHSHVFMPLPGTPFENQKTGYIDPELERFLDYHASKGRLYGSHHHQIKHAKALYDKTINNDKV
ncbi:MAG: TIGR04013 family B12-binding domain/radical SAM domain-containing protein [Promethearchaeota archaeon]